MRFLVLSDIHLHEWAYGSKLVDGRNSRLEQQINAIQQCVKHCQSSGITSAIVTGDIYHTSTITAGVSEGSYRAFRAFADAGIHLTIVPGNHDQATRSGELDALAWFSPFATVVGRCHEVLHSIGDVQAECIPFTHDRDKLRRRIDELQNGTRLLFMHQGVSGVEINSKGFTLNEALSPDMIPDSIACFTGHYHSAKCVKPNLVIPGSLTQLNWGDKNEHRGWMDVELQDNGNLEIVHNEAAASKFVELTSLEDLTQVSGNFIRLMTTENAPSFVEDAVLQLNKAGAESVEVKQIVQIDTHLDEVKTQGFNSLNEIIYAFANSKVRSGVIDEYDLSVGDQLLKGNYQAPDV